jgi:hypothetical protein
VSLTVDLQPGPAVVLAATADVSFTVDLATATASFASAAVTVDLQSDPAASLTFDATVDDIIGTSVVGGGITLDAHPGAVSNLAPGTASVIVLDIDGCFGPPGPQGPPGSPGSGTFRYTQTIAAAVWTIVHGLGFYPNVVTTDTAGTEMIGDVRYVDINTVEIAFSSPLAGYANLS